MDLLLVLLLLPTATNLASVTLATIVYMKAPFLALGARKGAFMYLTSENHDGGLAGTGVVSGKDGQDRPYHSRGTD